MNNHDSFLILMIPAIFKACIHHHLLYLLSKQITESIRLGPKPPPEVDDKNPPEFGGGIFHSQISLHQPLWDLEAHRFHLLTIFPPAKDAEVCETDFLSTKKKHGKSEHNITHLFWKGILLGMQCFLAAFWRVYDNHLRKVLFGMIGLMPTFWHRPSIFNINLTALQISFSKKERFKHNLRDPTANAPEAKAKATRKLKMSKISSFATFTSEPSFARWMWQDEGLAIWHPFFP